MGAINSQSANLKFYSLKAKVDETNSPHFALIEKVNEKWQSTEQFNQMSGRLDSATIREKEYQGAKFNVFELVMSDDKETSKIELTHNSITHNIINCLATDCNKLDEYCITLAKKKSKDGKYWNGAAYINVNGNKEMLKWSLDPQSAPKKELVMVNGLPFMQGGKNVYDDSKVKTFWEQVFKDKIEGALGVSAIKANIVSSEPSNSDLANDNSDPLPF